LMGTETMEVIRFLKKLWTNRLLFIKAMFILVCLGIFVDLIISMFFLWSSEGLYNEPPMWFTNALLFIASSFFENVKYVVVTYPSYVFSGLLFLLAPFYKELIKCLKKLWRTTKIEIIKIRRTATVAEQAPISSHFQ
jgi:hypothetical protein